MYTIQTLDKVSGEWVDVPGNTFSGNKYTGQQFRIVATPANRVSGDAGLVQIRMYYDGNDEDNYAAPVNVGEYKVYCDGLTGDSAANYALSNSIPACDFEIVKADHNIEVEIDETTTVTYDGNPHDLAIKSIIENGDTANPVAITRLSANTDEITLADGCTITLQYSIEAVYVDGRYNPAIADLSDRGSMHAGTFVLTIMFVDTPENAKNYNQFADVKANLVVEQAPYRGDGVNVGLSEDQLQRYLKDAQGNYVDKDGNILTDGSKVANLNGFGGNNSVDFDADKGYKPQLNFGSDASSFNVEYTKSFKAQGTDKFVEQKEWPTFQIEGQTEPGVGFHDPGTYRVNAVIRYENLQYANDYLSLSDYSVELKILPGEIEKIEVVYDQIAHEKAIASYQRGFTYGDTFDFYDMNANGYVVKITAVYKPTAGNPNGSREPIDNERAQFLNEKGQAFVKFDRATILEDTLYADDDTVNHNNPVTPDASDKIGDVYYKIGVSVYGKTGTLTVKVRQETLQSDSIGFDEVNDSNIQRVSGTRQWKYSFSYDGVARYPALSESIRGAAYNFVGIDGDTLVAGTDVVATYELLKDGNYVSMHKDGKVVGLADAGNYTLRVRFTNNNKNYKAIVEANTNLACDVVITAKELAASDILWQWCTDSSFEKNKTNILQLGDTLPYRGRDGYFVRAVFRNLADTNPGSDTYYLPVDTIALGGTAGSNIQIIDADTYSIDIQKLQANNNNYVLPGGSSSTLTADIQIVPYEVTLTWKIDGVVPASTALTYNGYDQLSEGHNRITAEYAIPDGFKDTAEHVSVAVATIGGEAAAEGSALENVGIYGLIASIDNDTNYVPKNETYNVTINPHKVDAAATGNVWSYNYNGATKYIASDGNTVEYIGKDVPVYLEFVTLGEGKGDDGTNKRIVNVKDANGEDPHDAGSYDLALASDGNYDLSALTQKFVITKAQLEVEWLSDTEYVYDGKNHTIEADVNGLLGDDASLTAADAISLANATQRNASTDGYLTFAAIATDHAKNYTLKGAAADGTVAHMWNITKAAIGVNWNTGSLVYNNGYEITDWTYEVTGLQTSDEGVQDNVTLDYEIYMLGSGEPQLVRNMKDSGSYYIQVVGVSDSNYTISGIERHDVTVDQATPVIADVVYKEYSTDNVTYAGNEKLRNEKLSYTAKCNDVDVAGKLEFADSSAASIATVGTNYHYCVFTPENANYKSVEYRDLRIEVKPDSVERLGYDSKTVLSLRGRSTVYPLLSGGLLRICKLLHRNSRR